LLESDVQEFGIPLSEMIWLDDSERGPAGKEGENNPSYETDEDDPLRWLLKLTPEYVASLPDDVRAQVEGRVNEVWETDGHDSDGTDDVERAKAAARLVEAITALSPTEREL
jgi:hypothetical protein